MPKYLGGSAFALDEAIGRYRRALADLLGCSVDTIDLWCTPPPGFSPNAADNRGRRNPLDELAAIARHCPGGIAAVGFLVNQLGYRLAPIPDTSHDDLLFAARPVVMLAAAEKLGREANRVRAGRKPRLSLDQMKNLRDEIAGGFDALVTDYEQRRRKAGK